MIAAMAKNRIIGIDNQMPWHLPADFAWFKKCTMGKPIVMGRKTYESIGRPLPGRLNIVLSRDANLQIDGVTCVTSIEEAKQAVGDIEELMIIGGGTIYQAFLDKADTLHLTFIELAVEGDTQFPDYEAQDHWEEISREAHTADEKNPHDFTFVSLVRV